MSKAVVLLSGGLDSATCMGIADDENDELIAVSFYYGQRHRKEIEGAKAIAEWYGAEWRLVQLPAAIFHNEADLLTGKKPIPKVSYNEIQGVSPVYCPYRNGVFVSVAGAVATANGAERVYFGAHSEDARTFAYSDCTPEFIGGQACALYVGSGQSVRLITPLQWLTKKEVLETADLLDVPTHLTWSCYEGGEKQCGECPTCRSRIEAFKSLGLIDPVPYAIEVDWHGKEETLP